MDQQDYYQALLSRKKDLTQQISRHRDFLQTPEAEMTNELSSYDQHPGDLGTDMFEREKSLGLLEMLEFEMKKVDDALAQFDDGAYGVCDQCGQTIEPARLKRVPNTTLCAGCARGNSDHFNRPAEEAVTRPGGAYSPGFDIAGYKYDEYK